MRFSGSEILRPLIIFQVPLIKFKTFFACFFLKEQFIFSIVVIPKFFMHGLMLTPNPLLFHPEGCRNFSIFEVLTCIYYGATATSCWRRLPSYKWHDFGLGIRSMYVCSSCPSLNNVRISDFAPLVAMGVPISPNTLPKQEQLTHSPGQLFMFFANFLLRCQVKRFKQKRWGTILCSAVSLGSVSSLFFHRVFCPPVAWWLWALKLCVVLFYLQFCCRPAVDGVLYAGPKPKQGRGLDSFQHSDHSIIHCPLVRCEKQDD